MPWLGWNPNDAPAVLCGRASFILIIFSGFGPARKRLWLLENKMISVKNILIGPENILKFCMLFRCLSISDTLRGTVPSKGVPMVFLKTNSGLNNLSSISETVLVHLFPISDIIGRTNNTRQIVDKINFRTIMVVRVFDLIFSLWLVLSLTGSI